MKNKDGTKRKQRQISAGRKKDLGLPKSATPFRYDSKVNGATLHHFKYFEGVKLRFSVVIVGVKKGHHALLIARWKYPEFNDYFTAKEVSVSAGNLTHEVRENEDNKSIEYSDLTESEVKEQIKLALTVLHELELKKIAGSFNG